MGIIVVPYAAAGSRTFALDSRASCPTCTTVPRAIQLASIPGEEVSSPGPPPLRPCQTKRHSLAIRGRGGRSSGCLSGTLRRPPSSESHRRRPLLVPPRSHALYPVVPVTNLTAGARVHPRSVGPSQWHSAQSRKASQGLPHVRRHPVDG